MMEELKSPVSSQLMEEEELIKKEIAKPAIPKKNDTLTEESVDNFKEELKKIDDEKQRKKDALKARIKAAQERNRIARQEQAKKQTAIRNEQESILQELEKPTKQRPKIEPEIIPPPTLPPPTLPPPVLEQQVKPPPVTRPNLNLEQTLRQAIMTDNTLTNENDFQAPPPPPPSYDMFDQMTIKNPPTITSNKPFIPPPPPPPVDLLEEHPTEFEKLPSAPPMPLPVPMAPPMEEPINMNTLTSVHQLPPPSYQDYEQEEISVAINSEEETQRLVKEQEQILKQIEEERTANDIAIAEAATSDFRHPSEQVETSSRRRSTNTSTSSASSTSNSINIGTNTKVTLRGDEQTKAAIEAGTAMIVQCLVCRNWMQVANTATLMFCPSCSTISRAEPQNQVTTIEEARLLMAHKRKKDRQEEKERKLKAYKEMSWGQYVKSFFAKTESTTSSYPAETRDRTEESYRSRSSTDAVTQQQILESVQMYGGNTSIQEDEEERPMQRLLPVQTYPSVENTAPAQIAERKPVYSCLTEITKSLSKFPGSQGQNNDDIDGVDSSALLSVTRVGRNRSDYEIL